MADAHTGAGAVTADAVAAAPAVEEAKPARAARRVPTPHSGVLRNKGTPASLRKRSEAFSKHITKRGLKEKKDEDGVPIRAGGGGGGGGGSKVSPAFVAFLAFLLIGSTVVGVLSQFGKSSVRA